MGKNLKNESEKYICDYIEMSDFTNDEIEIKIDKMEYEFEDVQKIII